MKKIQFLLLCLLFPILLYGRGNLKDTVTIRVDGLVYELSVSLDSTENGFWHETGLSYLREADKTGKSCGEKYLPIIGQMSY